jgi:predicted RNase H-like HicB family nuclease
LGKLTIQAASRRLVTEDDEDARAMILQYVALMRKEEATDYWIDIPDIPGCVSTGDTREEAEANIKEALELHIDAMRNQKLNLPQPHSRIEVLSSEQDSYVGDYMIEIEEYKNLRRIVAIQQSLHVSELSEADIKAITEAKMPADLEYLNDELED